MTVEVLKMRKDWVHILKAEHTEVGETPSQRAQALKGGYRALGVPRRHGWCFQIAQPRTMLFVFSP